MTAVINQVSRYVATLANAPFIAADVGGTHVRIGLVSANSDPAHPIQVLRYAKYRCAEYPGLAEILQHFIGTLEGITIDEAAIASAGYPLDDGTLISANLPWRVSLNDIRTRLGFRSLRLVNDFEAVAHAAACVDASKVLRLTGPATAPNGPMLVIGPGTGLGAAIRVPTKHGPVVIATEAGQATLTTVTDLEMALVQQMRQRFGHVSVEHALSGPGLMNLYIALCELRSITPVHATPGAITTAAQSGDDALAREILDVFCGLLGGMVGDIALLCGLHGGIYLAGGILPQIREFLIQSSFVERFLSKGRMREVLERIPVTLVEHGQLGVIGAASWYLGQRN